MGLIETIRAAVAGPVNDTVQADEPGADASMTVTTTEEESMSTQNTAPGADANAGMTDDALKAALAKAEADGRAAGRKEAYERLAAVLGAEGINGDGKRMAAALDLAIQSPDMASDAVVAFVTANVASAASNADSQAAAYEQQRLKAAGLTEPAGHGARQDGRSRLSAHVDRIVERIKASA